MLFSWFLFVTTLSYPPAECQRPEAIVWDPDVETARQLQGRLCPERCNGTRKTHNASGTMCPVCFPCECHQHCHKYGACCHPLGQDSWTLPHVHKADCLQNGNAWTLSVITCDPSYPNNETRTLCESKTIPRRLDTVLPVTATGTGVTYANMHCAICNADFSKMATWEMSCQHNQYLYDVMNDTQYDLRALMLPEVCSPVLTSFPFGKEHSCSSSRYHYHLPADLISTCNVTGRWEEDKAHVRRACEESNWSRGDVVILPPVTYANVFCGMCNEAPGTFISNCTSFLDKSTFKNGYLTHTELLRSNPPVLKAFVKSVRMVDCPDNHWKHPEKGCQKLQCSTGKVMAESGNHCVTPVNRVRGLGYHLHILLQPVVLMSQETQPRAIQPVFDSQRSFQDNGCNYADAIRKEMDSIRRSSYDVSAVIKTRGGHGNASFCQVYQPELEELMEGNITDCVEDGIVKQRKCEIGDSVQLSASFLEAVMEMNIIAPQEESRDAFEEQILTDVFSQMWTVQLEKWTVKFKARDLTSGLLGHFDKSIENDLGVSQKLFPYERQMDKERPFSGLEHLFLPLSKLLLCQYVSFEREEFEIDVSEGFVRVRFSNYLDSNMTSVSFDDREYPSQVQLTDEEKLLICFTAFVEIFPENVTFVHPGRDVSFTRQVMGAASSTISVVCSVATFITYSLFSELRSLPGLNNMALCFNLAAAHLSLLLVWLRVTGNEHVCVVVGLATHWLWLMALLWMSVGCVHMMRVFISQTPRSLEEKKRGKTKAFLCNFCLTLVVSSGIVLITVVVSHVVSQGSSIGYGGAHCFLDTELHPLLILAFLAPLGIVVLTNLVCFVLTVIAIMRVRRLQAQASSKRRDVLAYAKLSTVTGGAWLLGVLADVLGQEWMLVVAELCMASQGLLLFLSYVCNGRVWGMYRARLGPYAGN